MSPPNPPPPPSRVQLVLDGTVAAVTRGPVPPYAGGSFYQPVFGQPWFHPNSEFVLEWRPVEGLTVVGDVGAGNNYLATQPIGWQHGHPIDLVQYYVEYCRGVFCIDVGRRAETFGVETINPVQRDYTFVSPNFSISPFTRTGGSIGLRDDKVTWRAGASPGPDRHWNGDNNAFPWFFTFFNYTGTDASFFTNFQMGPDRDADTRHWRINTDAGLTLNPARALQLGLYGFYMTEQSPAGPWQHTGGGNFYLRARAEDGPVAGLLRLGFTHDDGARTGTATDWMQITAGLNVYGSDWMQVRLQGDLLVSVNGSRPFEGQAVLPRAGLQILFHPFAEFGRSSDRR